MRTPGCFISDSMALLAEGVSEGAMTALGNKDIKGKHPGDKDYERMDDLMMKANGSESKALALASMMARSIGRGADSASRDKAHRRAKAALDVFPGQLGKQIAQMFMDAADVKILSKKSRIERLTKVPGCFITESMTALRAAVTESYDIAALDKALEKMMPHLKQMGFKSKKKQGATYDLTKPLDKDGSVVIANFGAPYSGDELKQFSLTVKVRLVPFDDKKSKSMQADVVDEILNKVIKSAGFKPDTHIAGRIRFD